MLNQLNKKFGSIIKKIKNQAILNEKNIANAIDEAKVTLLDSDVNIEVVNKFIDNVKQQALGKEISRKLNASQEVIKIFYDQLNEILKQEKSELKLDKSPACIMMVGLQGSGKTTTTIKLAKYIKKTYPNKKILIVAADIYRLAAIDQLLVLGKQNQFEIYYEEKSTVLEIVKNAYHKGQYEGYDVILIDTAGRLHIDKPLIKELKDIKTAVKPAEILMVVDAMSGQDSINVIKEFNKELKLSGVILTKMDSDAKGGVALSISYLLNIPIKFLGLGEKVSNLDVFYPDRLIERIFGKGDVITLIEKITEEDDEDYMAIGFKRMLSGKFDLDDLYKQMKQIRRLGKLQGIMRFLPNSQAFANIDFDKADQRLKVAEVLISSMTLKERKNPKLLNESVRKQRIIKGSGRTAQEYNQLLRQWEQSLVQAKQMKNNPAFSQMLKTNQWKKLKN